MWPELILSRSDGPLGVLPLLVFVAIVLVVSLPGVLKENRRRLARRAWSAAARALGFDRRHCRFSRLLRLHGVVDGQTVTVRSRGTSRSDPSSEGTFYDVEFRRPLGTGLRIQPRTSHRHESGFATGDPEFDRAVAVRTVDPADAQDWLDADRRARLLRALHVFPGLVIDHAALGWQREEIVVEAQALVADVRQLAALARSLLRPAHAHTAAPLLDLDSTPPPVPPRRHPPPLPAQPEPPGAPFAPAFEPRPVLQPTSPPEPEAAEAGPDEGLNARDVAIALFSGGLSSFEADRRFEAEMKRQPVSGVGELFDVDAYSVDFDFGGGAGTKAVLKLEGLPEETFANREVLVLLQLPEGQEPALSPRIGESLAFAGTLHRADAFLRKLLVRAATVR